MTLKEFQLTLCTILNGDETLRLGGCTAIAEDQLDIGNAIAKQLQTVKGVCIIVVTPKADRIGGDLPGGGIPVQIEELTISAIEMPTLNRARPGAITALQAAERIGRILAAPGRLFQTIHQTADEHSGTLSAAAIFKTTIILTAAS